MRNVADFTDDQKKLFRAIIDDFGGPTVAGHLLEIIDSILGETAPDWELDPQALSEDLRSDVEVCMAALQYREMSSMAEEDR